MNETNINQDEVMLQLLSSNFGEEFITQSQADNKLFTYKKCEYYTGTQMLLQSAQEYNQLLSLNINCQQSLEIFKVGQKNSSTFILYKNLVIPSLSISIDGVIPPNVQLSFELKCFGRRRSRECSQTSYGNSTQGNRCQYQEVEFENESNIITIMNQNGAASFKSVRFSQTSEETTNISNQYKFFVLVKFQKKDDYENKSHLLSLYRSPAFTIVSRKKSLQKRNAAINLIQPFVPLEFLKRLEYKKNSEDTQKEITDQGIDGFMEFISNSNIRHKVINIPQFIIKRPIKLNEY